MNFIQNDSENIYINPNHITHLNIKGGRYPNNEEREIMACLVSGLELHLVYLKNESIAKQFVIELVNRIGQG